MKIHIVQKGDTLWKLAQKYNVNFEELKQMNTQLANPDMIMPGMKIKIPSTTKQVQKQSTMDKTIHPYKDTSPKAMPVVEEDDKKAAPKVKKEMPKPIQEKQMPMQPIQMPSLPDFYSNNYNIDVDIEDNDTEVNQYAFHQMNQQPSQQKPTQQPIQQPMQQPIMPMCYVMPPCMPMYPMPHPQPIMHPKSNHCDEPVDPCETFQSPQQLMQQQPMWHHQQPMMPPFNQDEEEMESSSVDMPPLPNQSMPMQQQYQQMPYGDWPDNMPQAPMWSPMQQQSPMQQAPTQQPPHMGGQGPSMPPNMMQQQPYQTMPSPQPGMPMPYQGNMNPYQQQGAFPYREDNEENE
ncbi:SafA/ExsA family spore coat assembly protein [Paraliobacillus sp. PM-2]|uniref:SafA/ExsA family spore coat assembly protein n=1 Tax=Paraliobacillus sp. PM-2 TaxID=1462524 RepID=UPI00159EE118|nr:SafA/ExsA family spore coat assembly protein [Paraliobacillus sp. PM-2]